MVAVELCGGAGGLARGLVAGGHRHRDSRRAGQVRRVDVPFQLPGRGCD